MHRGAFVDWFGRDHARFLRRFAGEWWYPKDDGRAELLAYSLAAGLVNAAEVRPAPPEWNGPKHSVIVRIAQQYEVSDLPIRNLDEAVAAELVFSLWIRRRDTHAFNRVYVDGIPVFFDHHIAFGVMEVENRTTGGFLRDGGDGGYVPRWRVLPAGSEAPVVTGPMRSINRSWNHAIHAVSDVDGFLAAMGRWIDTVTSRDLSDLERRVGGAGFLDDETAPICRLLRRSQAELPVMAARVCRLLSEPMDDRLREPALLS